MRILFLTRKWHGVGGMQRLSRDLWRATLQKYGERSAVCHPYSEGKLWLVPFAVAGFFRGLRADRIHLGDGGLAPLGVMIRFCTGASVTVTLNGLDTFYDARWYRTMLRWTLPTLDAVICVSRCVADAAKRLGVEQHRISIIPCGVWGKDAGVLPRTASDHPIIVTVGRLIPRKGVLWFVRDALPELLKKIPDLEYRIIGNGPDLGAIRSVIAKKHLEANVHIVSSATDVERDQHLAEADMLLVPNIAVRGDGEGFGIVCIEAAARGIPVVAARIEGLQDSVLEGKTGRLFDGGNASACIGAIEAVLKNPMKAHDVHAAALDRFDWSKLFPQYDSVFCRGDDLPDSSYSGVHAKYLEALRAPT